MQGLTQARAHTPSPQILIHHMVRTLQSLPDLVLVHTCHCAPQGTVVFNIDGEKWTLVLNPGERKVFKGEPEGKPNLTLTISDENFVKLVMGKMGPQQVLCYCAWPFPSLTWIAACFG